MTYVFESFSSLFKNTNQMPPVRSEAAMVCESLMTELETQMREMERVAREKERESRRKANLPDYSWLISAPTKVYEMTQLERLELEELASKVKPAESGQIIVQFRDILSREPDVSELPNCMKCVIQKSLHDRSISHDDTGWLTRSVTNLSSRTKTLRTHSSSRVFPMSVRNDLQEDLDKEPRSHSLPEIQHFNDLPV